MHLHFECQCLSTKTWAYFLDEAVIARALPRVLMLLYIRLYIVLDYLKLFAALTV